MDRVLALSLSLLVVAVVVITAYNMPGSSDSFDRGHAPSIIQFHIGGNNATAYTFTVVQIEPPSGCSVMLYSLEYSLLSDTFHTIEHGELNELTNSSMLNSTNHICFNDDDHNGKLSIGDRIVLLGDGNGGQARPGWYFRIVHDTTDDTFTQILLW